MCEAPPYDGASLKEGIEADRRTGLVLLSCGGRGYLFLCCISVLASFLRSFVLSSGLTFSLLLARICSPFGVACVFSVFCGGGWRLRDCRRGYLISREVLLLHFPSASDPVVAVSRSLPSVHWQGLREPFFEFQSFSPALRSFFPVRPRPGQERPVEVTGSLIVFRGGMFSLALFSLTGSLISRGSRVFMSRATGFSSFFCGGVSGLQLPGYLIEEEELTLHCPRALEFAGCTVLVLAGRSLTEI